MWQVIGQDRAVSLLQGSLKKGNLGHAYLLIGPPHVGKMTLALKLAQAVNCEVTEPPCGECAPCRKIAMGKHADVQVIGLSAGGNSAEPRLRAEISIAQIRELQHTASLPPFEGRSRVFIIDGAEQLSTEAANCLLKTLEEPAGRVIFILLTTNDRLLHATVVSRCQRLELPPLATANVEGALISCWGVDPEMAGVLARLSGGCLGWAVSAAGDAGLRQQREERIDRLLEIITADGEERFAYAGELATQFGQNRRLVMEVLDLWLSWWRDLLLVRLGCRDMITNVDWSAVLAEQAGSYSLVQIRDFMKDIQATKEQLSLNASSRLALEVLMLGIPEERR
jgi:DNA polymerase-3 subunit delta'